MFVCVCPTWLCFEAIPWNTSLLSDRVFTYVWMCVSLLRVTSLCLLEVSESCPRDTFLELSLLCSNTAVRCCAVKAGDRQTLFEILEITLQGNLSKLLTNAIVLMVADFCDARLQFDRPAPVPTVSREQALWQHDRIYDKAVKLWFVVGENWCKGWLKLWHTE